LPHHFRDSAFPLGEDPFDFEASFPLGKDCFDFDAAFPLGDDCFDFEAAFPLGEDCSNFTGSLLGEEPAGNLQLVGHLRCPYPHNHSLEIPPMNQTFKSFILNQSWML
jgi:hypothetical protein